VRTEASPYLATIVARRRETLDDLTAYLEGRGIATQALGAADPLLVEWRSRTVILFPDDFECGAVLGFIRSLRASRPRVLVLVVTRDRRPLHGALAADGRSVAPIVLARPPFGWSIVDAIRDHQRRDVS
jgi:hypothetical protein